MLKVLVVGAGLIGLSSAWRLSQKGYSVIVYDAGEPGQEASWAGAGMLAPGGEFQSPSPLAAFALRSAEAYPAFVAELTEESGTQIDYRRCGALTVAPNDTEWQNLLARAAVQSQFGIASEIHAPGRLFYPADSAVDPRHLLRSLTIACKNRGVIFRSHTSVQTIVAERSQILHPEPADRVVLAAGAWSSGISFTIDRQSFLLPPAYPVRGHLISYRMASAPGPILRQGATYIVQRSDGLTIAGSSMERIGFHRSPDPALFQDIERRAQALMPALRNQARHDAWIGFRPGNDHDHPILYPLFNAPVFLAYGHFRNGILLAPATADLIANWETGPFYSGERPESSLEPAGTA